VYLQYFGLNEAPFSITPDPAFVYLSAAHRDALAHLMYGIGQGGSGGFVQLTGEVGTGKTTMSRCLLEQLPEDCRVALVLNPLVTPRELLATICEELGLETEHIRDSNKGMIDALNAFLLGEHALGRRVVVVIDEAQNLSPEALEQVRLLTNLETAKQKLLQMVFLGQPELRRLLQRQDLRQLAQRVTARYHLMPLDEPETRAYVLHRMKVAGAVRNPFRKSALRALYQRSRGVPRLINIIADRALAAAFADESPRVNARMVNAAANEVQPSEGRVRTRRWPVVVAGSVVTLLLIAGGVVLWQSEWLPGAPRGATATVSDTAGDVAGMASSGSAREGPNPAAIAPQSREPGVGSQTQAVNPAIGQQMTGEPDLLQPESTAHLDSMWLASQHLSAWDALGALWQDEDAAAAIRMACNGALRTGYACIREHGSWLRIRQLGLPVVLVLRDEETRLLVLRGFEGGTLLVGSTEPALRIARDAVEQRWLGEYYVVWPQAPDWPVELRKGETGAAVDIVMEMAALAEPAWNGHPVFDENFESWLVAFQRRHGLQADGIIGPRTLMYLVAPTISEPRLVFAPTEES